MTMNIYISISININIDIKTSINTRLRSASYLSQKLCNVLTLYQRYSQSILLNSFIKFYFIFALFLVLHISVL